MLYHKFDPETNFYVESVESDVKPENSVEGTLPETTKYYTLMLSNGQVLSVLRPNIQEILDAEVMPETLP